MRNAITVLVVVVVAGMSIVFSGLNGSAETSRVNEQDAYRVYLPSILKYATGDHVEPSPTPIDTPVPTSTPLPTITPSPTSTPCNTWIQVLQNPSFEEPLSVGWSVLGPNIWRSQNYTVDGSYSLYMGGFDFILYDYINQQVQVPNWAENGALYLAWLMFSEDSTTDPYNQDWLYVEVWDWEEGRPVKTYSVPNTASRGVWQVVRLPINSVDIIRMRGQQVIITLAVHTNGAYPTAWYVDRVWLVFGCGDQVAELEDSLLPTK